GEGGDRDLDRGSGPARAGSTGGRRGRGTAACQRDAGGDRDGGQRQRATAERKSSHANLPSGVTGGRDASAPAGGAVLEEGEDAVQHERQHDQHEQDGELVGGGEGL